MYENDEKSGVFYHFYFDYKDGRHHLDYHDQYSLQSFLERAGKILAACPMSDSGVYTVELDKGKYITHKPRKCGYTK
jgi:hypothetical protein